MAMQEFKQALKNDPTLVQRNPSDIARQYHLSSEETKKVEALSKQCMGLKGKELEDRITKGGFWDV